MRTVFNYSGMGTVNSPPFTVNSSPWKLQFTASWTGNFALEVRGQGGIDLVANQPVTAGVSYQTFVYGWTGTLYFSASSVRSDGEWTLGVVENPVTGAMSLPSMPAGTVFTYRGKGTVNSPPFTADSSPWKLQFMASWTGNLALQVRGQGGIDLVANQPVTAGVSYQTFVYGWTGTLYFSASSVPSDGEWTVVVIKGSPL